MLTRNLSIQKLDAIIFSNSILLAPTAFDHGTDARHRQIYDTMHAYYCFYMVNHFENIVLAIVLVYLGLLTAQSNLRLDAYIFVLLHNISNSASYSNQVSYKMTVKSRNCG